MRFSIDRVKEMAKKAERVLICDNNNNYTVSKPNTFPILNVRQGHSIHNKSQPLPLSEVDKY